DADGRQIDMHALKTTLGTRLARAGVAPQVAKMVLQHSDMRTTLNHYTDLRLSDATIAVLSLPFIDVTATATALPVPLVDPADLQQNRQQFCGSNGLSSSSIGDKSGGAEIHAGVMDLTCGPAQPGYNAGVGTF